jgi:hypothetical protein
MTNRGDVRTCTLNTAEQPFPPIFARQRFALPAGALSAAALCLFLVSAAAASTGNRLAGDGRLERKVAAIAEGVPVGDLLNFLAKKTSVEIRASDYVADDKVVVFSPARPLRDNCDSEGAHPGPLGYFSVAVEVSWSWGGTATSWIVSLPAALPDDRRDKTTICVEPL